MYFNDICRKKIALWTRKTTTPTGLQYEEGEYIYNNASNCIDLGVEPTVDMILQMKAKPTTTTGDYIIGASKLGNDQDDWRLLNYQSMLMFDVPATSSSNTRITAKNGGSANTLLELELGNYYIKKVGATSNIVTGITQSSFTGKSGTIRIEGQTVSKAGSSGRAYWYYIKIYQGNTLIRDFIPAKLTADCTAEKCNLGTAQKSGAIGLYDKVNDMFYANSNTSGAFIFGAKS